MADCVQDRIDHYQNVESTMDPSNLDINDDFDPFPDRNETTEDEGDGSIAPPMNSWYHGRLERRLAEERLRTAGCYGSYLVRESERKPGSYVLSFLGRTGINHFRVTALCGDYYIGGREFYSLGDLIGYYTHRSDLLKQERLTNPAAPPEPVNDQVKVIAILPYNQIPETDELSFEKGEVFLVHNDLGDGWLWVTSQSTGLSGIVNKGLVQEIKGQSDPIESFDWFHPNISKSKAAEKLKESGSNSFLVRPSESKIGHYSLFFYCNHTVQRFRIEKINGKYYMGGRYFECVSDVIERYKKEQILLGHCLEHPVLRTRDEEGDNLSRCSFTRSSGSNFFLNRKDTIVINGYLQKKSAKDSKKWKTYYFVLNGTERHLYFFENDKRSKPKGLIDGNYSNLYPVHESLFGRPNCFQIIQKSFNHQAVFYLCAESSDVFQQWILSLKSYCQNTVTKSIKNSSVVVLTQLRSLNVSIKDAKKLGPKVQAYCVLNLNDVKVARTSVRGGPDAVWDEDFLIEDLPKDIESLTINVYCKGRMKDTLMFSVHENLSNLTSAAKHDWYDSCDCGSIRLILTYLHETIMPSKEYGAIKQIILEFENVKILSELMQSDTERNSFANAILQVFRHEKKEEKLLEYFTNDVIKAEQYVTTLFRADSMATTLMCQYMKMTAMQFVKSALTNTIEKATDGKTDQVELLKETLNSIFQAVEKCPPVIRYICHKMRHKAGQKWPDDERVKTCVVTAFIFLRLLCPALHNPKAFNLVTEAPHAEARNTLLAVTKSLQKLSNLSQKVDSLPYGASFVRNNQETMKQLAEAICEKELDRENDRTVSIDVARNLAKIHQCCSARYEQLKEMSKKSDEVKKILIVVDMLNKHKDHYINECNNSYAR